LHNPAIRKIFTFSGNEFVLDDAGDNEEYEIIVRGKNDNGEGPATKINLRSSGKGTR